MEPESPLERLRRLERQERQQAVSDQEKKGASGLGSAGRKGGVWGLVLIGLLFLAGKGKLLLFFLLTKGKLLLGLLKLGPILMTLSSMGLLILVHGQFYGFYLAGTVALLILVHELGHGIAARHMGLKVGAPIFIPFFGAMIMLKEQPRSTWVEAVVGFGGPFLGMLGGLFVLFAGLLLQPGFWQDLLLVSAWVAFLLNCFNLLPCFGLDGDRISQPFEFWHWIPGCCLVVLLQLVMLEFSPYLHPSLLFIVLLGSIKGGRAWYLKRKGPAPQRLVDRLQPTQQYVDEGQVQPWQRRAAAIAYFGLVSVLLLLLLYSEQLKAVSLGRL